MQVQEPMTTNWPGIPLGCKLEGVCNYQSSEVLEQPFNRNGDKIRPTSFKMDLDKLMKQWYDASACNSRGLTLMMQ